MTGSPESQASSFCVSCGLGMTTVWDFCPRCGARRVDFEGSAARPAPESYSRATRMRLEVKSLIDHERLDEAESLVRTELAADRSLEVLLVAADVLSRRLKVNDATDLLQEALTLAPDNYLVHIRRAEHMARVGMVFDALEATKKARRLLPPGDVPALAYCQEMERVLTDRSRGNFARGSSVPHFAARLGRFRKGEKAPHHLALQTGPEGL